MKDNLLIQYLMFIKSTIDENLITQNEIVNVIKDTVVLVTDTGRAKPSKESIHFSREYKPMWSFKDMFPGETDKFIIFTCHAVRQQRHLVILVAF